MQVYAALVYHATTFPTPFFYLRGKKYQRPRRFSSSLTQVPYVRILPYWVHVSSQSQQPTVILVADSDAIHLDSFNASSSFRGSIRRVGRVVFHSRSLSRMLDTPSVYQM